MIMTIQELKGEEVPDRIRDGTIELVATRGAGHGDSTRENCDKFCERM